jgi:hypothetical protein
MKAVDGNSFLLLSFLVSGEIKLNHLRCFYYLCREAGRSIAPM